MATKNSLYSKIKCGVLNPPSAGNKSLDISDLITENYLDTLAVAETWLNEYDAAKIHKMTPVTHTFYMF